MNFGCPGCGERYEFPAELMVDPSFHARCPACRCTFLVRRRGVELLTGPPNTRPATGPLPTPQGGAAGPGAQPDEEAGIGGYYRMRSPRWRQKTAPEGLTAVSEADVAEEPEEAPPPSPAARPTAHLARTVALTLGGAALVAAGAATATWFVRRELPSEVAVAGPPRPAASPAPAALPPPGPSPDAALPLVEADAGAPWPDGLAARIREVEPVDARNAAIVQGVVRNGSAAPSPARLEVTLVADGVPIRRRVVWCCDEFSGADGVAKVLDPKHPHFARRAPAEDGELTPTEERPFSVLFPSLSPKWMEAELGARVVVTGERAR